MSLCWGGADGVDKWPALHSLSRGLVPTNLITTHLRSHGSRFGPGLEESNYPGCLVAVQELGLQETPSGPVRTVPQPPKASRQVLWP